MLFIVFVYFIYANILVYSIEFGNEMKSMRMNE